MILTSNGNCAIRQLLERQIVMTTQTTTTVNNTATAAVVQNDAINAAGNSHTANYKRIEQLIIEREMWEQGAMRTSNEQLYALLAKCYALYGELCGTDANAKDLRGALDSVIAMKNYSFTNGTHTMTKIVKCVFGVDRRRVSAYSLVLREALSRKLKADDIATFIAKSGGVEEMRRSNSGTAKTAKQKAELGRQAINGMRLAVVSSDLIAEKLDLANVGSDLVAIVTQQADGSLIVRQLISNQSVLNAALACAYSANKTATQEAALNKKAANDDDARDALIKEAAKK